MGGDSDELRQSPREVIADLPQKWVGPLAKFQNYSRGAARGLLPAPKFDIGAISKAASPGGFGLEGDPR